MKAICIICIKPDKHLLEFYSQIKEYDIYFVCDSVEQIEPYPGVTIVQIADSTCIQNGYIHSNTFKKTPIGWDKALYYFCIENIKYSHVWFIEDDVLVPTINTIPNVDMKYGGIPDLLSANNYKEPEYTKWDHWDKVNKYLSEPRFCSMVCSTRISQRLLQKIRKFIHLNMRSTFTEAMFITLAYHSGYVISTIPELATITWRDTFYLKDIVKENLYHPVKLISAQKVFHIIFERNLDMSHFGRIYNSLDSGT